MRTLEANVELRSAVARLIPRPTECFQVDVGDSVKLDAYLIRPRDFDSTKTYPVLVHVYGEPAAQNVLDQWGGRRDCGTNGLPTTGTSW